MNIELTQDDVLALTDNTFINWLNETNLNKTNGTIFYSGQRIKDFISSIFKFLAAGNVCFSSGALVFNDFGKLLFNLLTFNRLELSSNSYNCNNPVYGDFNKPYVQSTSVLSRFSKPRIIRDNVTIKSSHRTHNKVFTLNKGISDTCLPTTTTKFEKIFPQRIEGLCDSPGTNPFKSESKSVILYYPFKSNPPDDNRYLFLKLERDQMLSVGHLSKAIASYGPGGLNENPVNGTDTITGFNLRREDSRAPECNYDYFRPKDIYFYSNYYNILQLLVQDDDVEKKRTLIEEDLAELDWYNTNVRTGCEFYITKNLLIMFFEQFLAPKKSKVMRQLDNLIDEDEPPMRESSLTTLGGNIIGKKRKSIKRHKKTKKLLKTKRNIKTRFKNIKKSFKK